MATLALTSTSNFILLLARSPAVTIRAIICDRGLAVIRCVVLVVLVASREVASEHADGIHGAELRHRRLVVDVRGLVVEGAEAK